MKTIYFGSILFMSLGLCAETETDYQVFIDNLQADRNETIQNTRKLEFGFDLVCDDKAKDLTEWYAIVEEIIDTVVGTDGDHATVRQVLDIIDKVLPNYITLTFHIGFMDSPQN